MARFLSTMILAMGFQFNTSALAVDNSELLILLIDKSNLSAQLKTFPQLGHPVEHIKTFEIAIGKKIGDKLVEGDQKDPGRNLLSPKSHHKPQGSFAKKTWPACDPHQLSECYRQARQNGTRDMATRGR